VYEWTKQVIAGNRDEAVELRPWRDGWGRLGQYLTVWSASGSVCSELEPQRGAEGAIPSRKICGRLNLRREPCGDQ
ncbi:Hypothetical predicted protein, partial [Pelobates cultripes]